MTTDALPFGKDRQPEYPETEARGKLSRKDRARLCLKQAGKCAGCGVKPVYGWEFDHVSELWEGGTNHFSNWQAFGSRRDCKCHAVKTAAAARRRAKMHRLRGNTGQVKRRKEKGSQIQSRPFPDMKLRESRDGRKWQSAGFRKSAMKRTVLGKVVPRERI
jgi:hypothetical protein